MTREKNLVIVRSVVDQGLAVAQAAARFGVSRQWVHALVRRYEADGPDGLAPRSRAPKSRPGTTSTAVRERVVQLRRQLTSSGADAGPETIAWHLRREGDDPRDRRPMSRDNHDTRANPQKKP